MNYYGFGQWLRGTLNPWLKGFLGQKKKAKDLDELLKSGLLSKEEFLRFKITRQQMILDKAKKELLNYLKKQGKK